ncbi:hypothetical protein HYALB_00004671 [Hymenoscyphus albidus]|uniref:Uncharacterized protein n=1 Tax=Hymenoscyphus albidus TaxID=595503 RepID=A0A9N9PXP3_9HELO|nr:hypothetical protein HYALB_00004671 [Hymenoscyphus albidus]
MSSSVKRDGNPTRSSSPKSLKRAIREASRMAAMFSEPPRNKEDDGVVLLLPVYEESPPNLSITRKKRKVEPQIDNKEEEDEEEQVEMVDLDLPTEAQTESNRRPVNELNQDLFEEPLNNRTPKENLAGASHVMELEDARPRKRIAIQDKPAEITFNNLMADIRAKRFEPLLHREDVKLDKELLNAAVAQRTPMMLAARGFLNEFSVHYNNTELFRHLPDYPILNLFEIVFDIAKLYIAKNNELDVVYTVEEYLPEDIPSRRNSIHGDLNDEEIRQTLRKDLGVYADDCRNKSSECLRQHMTVVQRRINNKYRGGGVIDLASLNTEQIRSLYGLIFDMHPVWIMTRFKAEESKVIDFASIWAYECEDRLRWRRFYRNMYIDMMTHTWILRVKNGDHKFIVAGYWTSWSSQQKVQYWYMSNEWGLPIHHKLVDFGAYYKGDPEEGIGEFVTPN